MRFVHGQAAWTVKQGCVRFSIASIHLPAQSPSVGGSGFTPKNGMGSVTSQFINRLYGQT